MLIPGAPEGQGVKRAGSLHSLDGGHNLASSKRQNPTWLSRTGSKVTCSSKEPFLKPQCARMRPARTFLLSWCRLG